MSQLEAGRSYYLSNTTGTIKRTGLWQWFKCVTGFGDGREKALRLAQRVKESLLANAAIKEDSQLTSAIAALDTTYSLYGSNLREIADRFKTAHASEIAAIDTQRLASKLADDVIAERVKAGAMVATPENLGYMKKIALYSVQHIAESARKFDKTQEELEREVGSAVRKVFWAINDVEVMQCMKTSKLSMPITKDSGVRRKGRNENTVLSIPRYNSRRTSLSRNSRRLDHRERPC